MMKYSWEWKTEGRGQVPNAGNNAERQGRTRKLVAKSWREKEEAPKLDLQEHVLVHGLVHEIHEYFALDVVRQVVEDRFFVESRLVLERSRDTEAKKRHRER